MESTSGGAAADPRSPARYTDRISRNFVHNVVAEYPASLDYAKRDERGNIILSASNKYLFTDNPVLLFAANQILSNREHLSKFPILTYVPTITTTPPPFEACAFICAANITDFIMHGLNYEGYFRGLAPTAITFLGEVLFVMMYRAFTRFGNINKRFVTAVNNLAGREIYKPRTLIFGFDTADPNVNGLPAGRENRLPTSAEVIEVRDKLFLNRLFMKRDIPGLSGRNKANARELQEAAAAQEEKAAFEAAEAYLTTLEDSLAEGMTIKQYFRNDFRRAIRTRFTDANYVTSYSTFPASGGTPTARGANFGFYPPAPVAASGGGSAAAPVMAPVATNAAAAPLAPSGGAGAGAGAGAANAAAVQPKKDKKKKGGSRTKKRSHRSSHQKRKSQKKSQKSRKSQKTRSRRHR